MTVSENHTVVVSKPFSTLTGGQSIFSGNVQVNTESSSEDNVSQGPKSAYKVNISQEAMGIQSQEEGGAEKANVKKGAKSENLREASEGEGAQSKIDEQIKKLQEEIREIKEKIRALANADSEEARQQRKVLEAQLLELTTQLLSLLEKKMQSA